VIQNILGQHHYTKVSYLTNQVDSQWSPVLVMITKGYLNAGRVMQIRGVLQLSLFRGELSSPQDMEIISPCDGSRDRRSEDI
jgi:hypothetical protein